jgi:hypothetical protein
VSKALAGDASAVCALPLGATACGGFGGGSSGEQGGGQSQAQAPTPVAEVANLAGKSTAVELDPEFVDPLEQLEVTAGPVGEAKIKEGVATFPITGGDVTYYEPGSTGPFVRGRIEHDGSGLTLTKGDTKIELTDFVVNPANSKLTGRVTANGEKAAGDAELFFLNGSTLKPLQTKGDEAILEGTTVTLTEDAAKLLNQTLRDRGAQTGLPGGDGHDHDRYEVGQRAPGAHEGRSHCGDRPSCCATGSVGAALVAAVAPAARRGQAVRRRRPSRSGR